MSDEQIFTDQLEALASERDSLRTQLREAQEQVARLTGERDESRERVRAIATLDLIAVFDERDALRAELSQAQADLAEAQRQRDEAFKKGAE